MGPLGWLEAAVGGALILVVPGFAVAKAVFPERRIAGRDGIRWAIELAALSLVLSVVLTVTVGYVLLTSYPGGFSATWTDPVLEVVLAGIAAVAFLAGAVEGAYGPFPPVRGPITAERGSEGAWEVARQLDRLQRERTGLEQALARGALQGAEDRARAEVRIADLRDEEAAVRSRREAEYEL